MSCFVLVGYFVMSEIFFNGESVILTKELLLSQLLEDQNVLNKRIAVEHNESIVPRSQFDAVVLMPGDCVEVVHAIGGG